MALGEPNRLWGSLSVPEDCLEDRSRLIAVVYCRKVRDGRQSQEKFTVDKRRILSTWGRSGSGTGCPAWEVVWSSPLEVFKPWLDQALSNLFWPQSWPGCEREVGPEPCWTFILNYPVMLFLSSTCWKWRFLFFGEKSWLVEEEPPHNGRKFVKTKAAGFLNFQFFWQSSFDFNTVVCLPCNSPLRSCDIWWAKEAVPQFETRYWQLGAIKLIPGFACVTMARVHMFCHRFFIDTCFSRMW